MKLRLGGALRWPILAAEPDPAPEVVLWWLWRLFIADDDTLTAGALPCDDVDWPPRAKAGITTELEAEAEAVGDRGGVRPVDDAATNCRRSLTRASNS